MARKRSPENDYLCIRCGCPCDAAGTKHLGGGQGMKACGKKPHARLRSEWDAEMEADADAIRAILKGDRLGSVDLNLDE
jgi:hypothetical protein